ncbi:MAG: glycerol-3-phosphate 1-O-acyltransferase PlsY [Gammaproteobacteria bacterium]|nr:glycerol-3-phosphate 1-O-acyltransferase PlsY [Gammaproteobacteria bacterium]
MYSLILFAYLLGSVNSAIIVCKLAGLPSPRTIGSGNPGATNVLRLGSKKAAACTLLGDVLKGIIPILIGHGFHLPPSVLCWIALAAILGHIYPLYFGFKGGKGVATAMGCVFAIHFLLGICVGATWLISAKTSRYSSLSSMISMTLMPFFALVLIGPDSFIPLLLITLFILIRHRSNIQKLRLGQESKIFQKK